MTNIVFYTKSGRITGFQSKGHAGYGMRGTDVVCASVSVLMINTVNSIEKFTDDTVDEDVNDKKATIRFRITGDVSHESELLLNALELGVTQISREYPGNVSIKYQDC